jgi:hypothetical protein
MYKNVDSGMSKLVKYSLYFLAFAPLWGILSWEYLDRAPNWLLGTIFAVISILYFFQLLIKKQIKIPLYVLGLLALFLYYLAWGLYRHFDQYGGFFEFLYKNPALFCFLIFLMIENSFFDQDFIKKIIVIFKCTIIIAFIVSIIQVFFIKFFLIPTRLYEDANVAQFGIIRFPSIFAYLDPNEIGFSFLPLSSIVMGYEMHHKGRPSFIFIVLSGIIAMMSSSRYIQIGFFLILAQVLVGKKISLRNSIIFVTVQIMIMACVIFVLNMMELDPMEYYYSRLTAKTYLSRVIGFRIFLNLFPQHPIFGTGEQVTDELSFALAGASPYIHVGYLSHLFEFGIIGSVLLFGVWGLIMFRAFRVGKKASFWGSVFGFLTFLFTNATLVEYSMFHYGLIFTLVFTKYYERVIKARDG